MHFLNKSLEEKIHCWANPKKSKSRHHFLSTNNIASKNKVALTYYPISIVVPGKGIAMVFECLKYIWEFSGPYGHPINNWAGGWTKAWDRSAILETRGGDRLCAPQDLVIGAQLYGIMGYKRWEVFFWERMVEHSKLVLDNTVINFVIWQKSWRIAWWLLMLFWKWQTPPDHAIPIQGQGGTARPPENNILNGDFLTRSIITFLRACHWHGQWN